MTKLTIPEMIKAIMAQGPAPHAETTEPPRHKEIKIARLKDALENDSAFHAAIKAAMQAASPQYYSKRDHNELIYHTHKCRAAEGIGIENRVKLENKQIEARLCYFCAQKIIESHVKNDRTVNIQIKLKTAAFCDSCVQKIMHDYVEEHQDSLNRKVYKTISIPVDYD